MRQGPVQYRRTISEEFPSLPKIDDRDCIRIESGTLNKMVERTSYAICQDETKYNLNGILLKTTEHDGMVSLKMVSTDGHRLSLAENEFIGTSATALNIGSSCPKKGVYEIKKITKTKLVIFSCPLSITTPCSERRHRCNHETDRRRVPDTPRCCRSTTIIWRL